MPISNENKAEGAFKLKLKIGEILRISWNELFATFLMKSTEFNAFHTQKTWLNLTNTSWVESESMNSGTIIVVRCSLLTLPRSKLKDGNQVFFFHGNMPTKQKSRRQTMKWNFHPQWSEQLKNSNEQHRCVISLLNRRAHGSEFVGTAWDREWTSEKEKEKER